MIGSSSMMRTSAAAADRKDFGLGQNAGGLIERHADDLRRVLDRHVFERCEQQKLPLLERKRTTPLRAVLPLRTILPLRTVSGLLVQAARHLGIKVIAELRLAMLGLAREKVL